MRFLLAAFCVLQLFGCASVPISAPSQNIVLNGVSYLALEPLCRSSGISFDYDTFSRSITLNSHGRSASLMPGENLVALDEQLIRLRHPVELYQGIIFVPARFKEEVIEKLTQAEEPAVTTAVVYPLKKVILDAGHGGSQPGAISKTRLKEKDLNLDLTKRVGALLRSEGLEVVFTRSADQDISLARRVEIANNSGAELFISIHANANRVSSLSGFEVYYLSSRVSDSARALDIAKLRRPDIAGAEYASDSLELKAALWDLIYTYDRAESIALARSICRAAGSDLETRIIGTKGANFYVLKGVVMPAVLIEVGFLTNRNEERMLKNNFYRQQLAETIARGIKNYAQKFLLARQDE